MGAEASASDFTAQDDVTSSVDPSTLAGRTTAGRTTPKIAVSHYEPRTEYRPSISAPPRKEPPHGASLAPEFDESLAVAQAVAECIEEFLRAGFSVVLEGFGIVTPHVSSGERSYVAGADRFFRLEETLTPTFEKSREITTYHRERFPRLIETKDLTQAVHTALPPAIGILIDEREVRRRIVELCRQIRQSVVERGFSNALAHLGSFYALHNRQGETPNDRFAGADIFLHPRFSRRLKVSTARCVERPILESGWELLAAAYGEPIETLSIDLPRELRALGYPLSPADEANFLPERSIDVAVFNMGGEADRPTLLYVTEGVRKLARSGGHPGGNELTFQLPIAALEKRRGRFTIPAWPSRVLTLGWLLVLSSRSRTVKPATGFSAELPLIPDCDTDLSAIFTTSFRPVKTPQLDRLGEFSFINLVGISAAEAELAQASGGEHLLHLLTHRGLDQLTKPTRSAVTARSVVEPPKNTL